MPKTYYWPYLILAARVLLACTLFRYGWAKLSGGQFRVDEKTMNMPLKEIDLFRLSWYLADHQPFKSFVGISQIVIAPLLVINRTSIVGAFMSIPIWLNILVWDITFMEGMTTAFTFRLVFYLLLTGLIIYNNNSGVLAALSRVSRPTNEFNYPFWVYMTIPIAALALEFIGAIPNAVLTLLR
jgi:uncharacterized membrane protein YphA (DoxX/SURF4 family)